MAGKDKQQVIARKRAPVDPKETSGAGANVNAVASAAGKGVDGMSRMAQFMTTNRGSSNQDASESVPRRAVDVSEVVVPRTDGSFRRRAADVEDLTDSSPEVGHRKKSPKWTEAERFLDATKAKTALPGDDALRRDTEGKERTTGKRGVPLQDNDSDLDSDLDESTSEAARYKKFKSSKLEQDRLLNRTTTADNSNAKRAPAVLPKVGEQDDFGPRLVIRRTFLEDKPVDSSKSWTRLFKKSVDGVVIDKVFPFLKFVNDASHLADVGYMGYIFEQLGYGEEGIEDSNFRTKNWDCIADYTQRKITSHRNNVVGECRRLFNASRVKTNNIISCEEITRTMEQIIWTEEELLVDDQKWIVWFYTMIITCIASKAVQKRFNIGEKKGTLGTRLFDLITVSDEALGFYIIKLYAEEGQNEIFKWYIASGGVIGDAISVDKNSQKEKRIGDAGSSTGDSKSESMNSEKCMLDGENIYDAPEAANNDVAAGGKLAAPASSATGSTKSLNSHNVITISDDQEMWCEDGKWFRRDAKGHRRPVLLKEIEDLKSNKVNAGKLFQASNQAYYSLMRRRCAKQRKAMTALVKEELDEWVRASMAAKQSKNRVLRQAAGPSSNRVLKNEPRGNYLDKKYEYMMCEDGPILEMPYEEV